jgi:hypothetical protein
MHRAGIGLLFRPLDWPVVWQFRLTMSHQRQPTTRQHDPFN